MADHNQFGQEGEEAVAAYLLDAGYRILHRNWRSGHKELDIVATEGNELVVVEVKSRKDTLFALPEDAVDARKIRRIVAATDAYLKKYAIDAQVRFDIITVVGFGKERKIEHIRDAFYPPIW